jgi:hypothetical protein
VGLPPPNPYEVAVRHSRGLGVALRPPQTPQQGGLRPPHWGLGVAHGHPVGV